MVHWWFGARWFGFLPEHERDCYPDSNPKPPKMPLPLDPPKKSMEKCRVLSPQDLGYNKKLPLKMRKPGVGPSHGRWNKVLPWSLSGATTWWYCLDGFWHGPFGSEISEFVFDILPPPPPKMHEWMTWNEMKWNEMKWHEMKWMNEWMNEWMNGCMDEWMNEWLSMEKSTVYERRCNISYWKWGFCGVCFRGVGLHFPKTYQNSTRMALAFGFPKMTWNCLSSNPFGCCFGVYWRIQPLVANGCFLSYSTKIRSSDIPSLLLAYRWKSMVP